MSICGVWIVSRFNSQMADKMSSETTRATKYNFVPTQKAYCYV